MSRSIFLPNGFEATQASYIEFPLEEFNSNPFIQALPPLANKENIIKKLTVKPTYAKEEILVEAMYRKQMTNRLFQLFQPLPIHIEVWNMLHTLIFQGYLARNPFDKNYKQYINQTGKEIINRSFDINNRSNFRSTAGCGLFLGYSGIGKTTTINRVLNNLPQVIVHNEYKGMHFNQLQLVWLKLEAPVNSSLKALCLQFFMKVDEILGTNNYKKHISRNSSVDNMLPLISQVAHNIGLGVLLIDEIQNIKKRGADQIMNFFVYLINAGINLCLIGTPSAYDLFGKELRITRRMTGNAEIIFNNLENSHEFHFLLDSIWSYQWTKHHVLISEELINLFYEETQGISDLMIKLFIYSQQEAIETGKEKITPQLVKKVARDKFKLLQPMLTAIRSGNPHKIAKYEDIRKLKVGEVVDTVEKPTRKKPRLEVKNTKTAVNEKVYTVRKPIKKNFKQDDMRYLLHKGKEEAKTPYQVLLENGFIETERHWIQGASL